MTTPRDDEEPYPIPDLRKAFAQYPEGFDPDGITGGFTYHDIKSLLAYIDKLKANTPTPSIG